MKYIDGFVLPLARDKQGVYREMSEKAGVLWREHGALEYIECVGDDMEAPDVLGFPELAGAGPDEVVIFSYIVYRDRAHRDEVNAKVMADPRMKEMCDPDSAPFDCKKMAYGGFKAFVEM